MVFKRLKPLFRYHKIPVHAEQSAQARFYRKLLLAALCETWVNTGRFSPLREGASGKARSLWCEQRLMLAIVKYIFPQTVSVMELFENIHHLAEIMQRVKQTFAVRFNVLDGRTGHIWGDRYWSGIVEGPPEWAEGDCGGQRGRARETRSSGGRPATGRGGQTPDGAAGG
jgi:hypothetical protein